MRILIGYSMRSGSTLLQHVLGQHSSLRSFSDVSSIPVLAGIVIGWQPGNVCVKPLDLLFLTQRVPLIHLFNKLIWITRDPRDSYLSSIESRYAYLFWPRGQQKKGIDVGLLDRWKRIHSHYFADRSKWHLVRYEDIVEQPKTTLSDLYAYLGIRSEIPDRLARFRYLSGGDYKLQRQTWIHSHSARRYKKEMAPGQVDLFEELLGPEMRALGYGYP